MEPAVTISDLSSLSGIPAETIRYHCRRGLLQGRAFQVNARMWLIPESAAAEFIDTYERYITLRSNDADE
jgi:hypothetical protein